MQVSIFLVLESSKISAGKYHNQKKFGAQKAQIGANSSFIWCELVDFLVRERPVLVRRNKCRNVAK